MLQLKYPSPIIRKSLLQIITHLNHHQKLLIINNLTKRISKPHCFSWKSRGFIGTNRKKIKNEFIPL